MTEGNPEKLFKTVVGGAIAAGAAAGAAGGPIGEAIGKEVVGIFKGDELLADVSSPPVNAGEQITVTTPEGEVHTFTRPNESTRPGE